MNEVGKLGETAPNRSRKRGARSTVWLQFLLPHWRLSRANCARPVPLDVSAAAWIILVSIQGEAEKGFAAMALGLLGLKVGMTQVYDDKGHLAPVTELQVGPCPVLQVRNKERDGYDAVQVGFLNKLRRKATRAERGHVS